ncbi:Phosphohistidine phosphatase SixA [Planctomycetales bacterium 10988]|nr:Phosphohistidine phosphatase SixA [Planctomycetales bacterium 10988]
MKTLFLLRHAKSSWKDTDLPDHDRPLNKRGKKDAPRMGKLLREQGYLPSLIISSTAKRARKTAKKFASECKYKQEIQLTSDLYHAGPQEMLKLLQAVPADLPSVMLVGHCPGIQDYLHQVTGYADDFPTAGLAMIELPVEEWTQLQMESQGELQKFWRPKEVD